MPRLIRLLVSCSPGVVPERQALGQALAELPISAGWEIKHTAGPGEDNREAVASVHRCDLHLALLDSDFAAPMRLDYRKAPRPDAFRLTATACSTAPRPGEDRAGQTCNEQRLKRRPN